LEIHYKNTDKHCLYAKNGDVEKFWGYILQFIVVGIFLLILASTVKKERAVTRTPHFM